MFQIAGFFLCGRKLVTGRDKDQIAFRTDMINPFFVPVKDFPGIRAQRAVYFFHVRILPISLKLCIGFFRLLIADTFM
jgi:hypothetical protein